MVASNIFQAERASRSTSHRRHFAGKSMKLAAPLYAKPAVTSIKLTTASLRRTTPVVKSIKLTTDSLRCTTPVVKSIKLTTDSLRRTSPVAKSIVLTTDSLYTKPVVRSIKLTTDSLYKTPVVKSIKLTTDSLYPNGRPTDCLAPQKRVKSFKLRMGRSHPAASDAAARGPKQE